VSFSVRDSLSRLFRRGGHGIHSPFVFDLITNVIEERRSYYCFEPLSRIFERLRRDRRALLVDEQSISVKRFLKRYCFSQKEYRLLFRIANKFQPKRIIVIGSDLGLTPLYLTAYSKEVRCMVYEPSPAIAAVAVELLKEQAVEIIMDDERMDFEADMLVAGKMRRFTPEDFERFAPLLGDKGVMIINGINRSKEHIEDWRLISEHPSVTVGIDLRRLGIVFFNPKLPRKIFKILC
jgi:hypothetical protein